MSIILPAGIAADHTQTAMLHPSRPPALPLWRRWTFWSSLTGDDGPDAVLAQVGAVGGGGVGRAGLGLAIVARPSAATVAGYSPTITPQEALGCGSNCRANCGLPAAAGKRRCEISQVAFTAISWPWMHAHECQHHAPSERNQHEAHTEDR